MQQHHEPLPSTRRLLEKIEAIGAQGGGGTVADLRTAALTELEAIRAKVIADRDAFRRADGASSSSSSPSSPSSSLEAALFAARDALHAVERDMATAADALKGGQGGVGRGGGGAPHR